nr:PREDICTED: polymeric immunoglobulin receptor-like [Latimeria chalumnae]|eukprot:XP_014340088.1 PREDICTED: polymeric immunoglobulin receptor-like [Latimeria chalumnae]
MDQLALLLILILAAGSEVGTEVVKGTRGGSVILYCRSAGKHSNDPKTWCKLNARNECTHVVRTDGYKNSSYGGRVQISDSNGLATVLMKQLEHSDTGTYLCGTYNIDMVFKLREVTLNISNDSRTSPREVRIPLGGSATLHCSYDKEFYGNCTKVWCKQTKEDYCGSEVFSHGKNEEKEGKTSISDDKTGGIITVTMEHLNTGDTGFYWCGIIIEDGSVLLEKINLQVVPAATVNTSINSIPEGPRSSISKYYIVWDVLRWILLAAMIACSGLITWCYK